MTIAAKHLDPLVGLDTHIILIPSPAGPIPTPLPHPYVGMVFDPMDYVPKFGATTYINGLPRGQAGSSGQALPPHIPMGGPFAKPPTNESEIFMGSATVVVDGEPQSSLGMPVLSCQDIGMPAIPRLKKKAVAKSLMLPTTVVLSVPAGPMVLIGGPPTISMSAMAFKLGLAALKRIMKLKAVARLLKAASDKAHSAVEKLMKKLGLGDGARNLVHKGICAVTGHPIDVATGKVFTDKIDLELPGPFPFKWERTWFSTSTYPGPLGHGWHHSYDMSIFLAEDVVLLHTSDGRHVGMPPLKEGREYFDRQEGWTWFADRQGYGLRDDDGLTYRFAGPGRTPGEQRLSHIHDRFGHTLLIRYDQAGHLSSIVDAAGRELQFATDDAGRILAITAPHPNEAGRRIYVAQYAYDAFGDLVAASDALGQRTTYQYEGHLLVRETNRVGLSFYFAYDGAGEGARCVHTWGDHGIYDHKLTYDLDASVTVVENSLGEKTTYHHRGGLPWKIIDPIGGVHLLTRNEFNEVLSETDPLGVSKVYEYDERGNIVKITAPDGGVTAYEYDERDLPVHGVDPIGAEWRWEYDEHERLTSRTDPLGRRTEFHWDGPRISRVLQANGHSITLGYDRQANLVSLTLPNGAVSRWGFDDLGNCVEEVDPNGTIERRRFDLLGRPVQIAETDGNVRDIAYDGEGNILHYHDAHEDVVFEYDRAHHAVMRFQAGTRLRFDYDTEEQLVAIHNERGAAYRYAYNQNGRVLTESGFDGKVRRTYKRDVAGRVFEVTRASGAKSEFTYDAAGRVLSIAHSDGGSETYRYAADGTLIEGTNQTCTVRLERDAAGKVVKELQAEHWVSSDYDEVDARTRVRSSKGIDVGFDRDSVGDVTRVRAGFEREPPGAPGARPNDFEATFRRDLLGQELERRLPGAVRSRWERDLLGRPVRQETWSGGRSVDVRQYAWAPKDRLLELIGRARGRVRFEYDGSGYLVAARHRSGVDLRLPDAVGNFYRSEDRTDRTYGPNGELLESRGPGGTVRYTYDPDGNLVAKIMPDGRRWTYHWSVAGRLLKVDRPDGASVEFGYDAFARRVWKKFRGETTRWIWDGHVPLHEWTDGTPEFAPPPEPAGQRADADQIATDRLQAVLLSRPAMGPPPAAAGALSRARGTLAQPITWLFEPDSSSPLGKLADGHAYGIVVDQVGAPSAMFDDEGTAVFSADIDVYGKLLDVKGSAELCPLRWPGQYEDPETGLYYNWCRYYDPEIGQYISPDPLGLDGGLAAYAYVHDPTTFFDFFGTVDGGTYSQVRASRVGGEVHHTPANSISPLSRGQGPSVWMTTADHAKTASHGSSQAAKDYRAAQSSLIKQNKWDKAIERDVRDIKKKFKGKYDQGIKEMLASAVEKKCITKRQATRIKKSCGVT